MHCLIVSNDFPNKVEPWRGPFHRRQVECLARLCKVSVIDPLPWTRLVSSFRLWQLLTGPDSVLDGIVIHHPVFWYLPVLGRGSNWRGVRSAAEQVVAALGADKLDVILATFAYPHGLAAKHLARHLGIPYVVKVRGSDLHSLPHRGRRRELTAEALRDAAAVVPVSKNLVEIAVDLGVRPDKVHLLPNGVDADSFPMLRRADARKRLGLSAGNRIVLFVGHLLPVKGVDVLLEAVHLLRERRVAADGIMLVMAGAGPMCGWIARHVARNGLKDSVKLLGHVSREDIALWMNAADALVLPSRNEGCPNVVLEALACGTPVVASRVGAVPDLLDETCGVIMEPEDAGALAHGIGIALSRDWDRAALRRRVEGMSWQANAERLHGILEAVVSSSKRRSEGSSGCSGSMGTNRCQRLSAKQSSCTRGSWKEGAP